MQSLRCHLHRGLPRGPLTPTKGSRPPDLPCFQALPALLPMAWHPDSPVTARSSLLFPSDSRQSRSHCQHDGSFRRTYPLRLPYPEATTTLSQDHFQGELSGNPGSGRVPWGEPGSPWRSQQNTCVRAPAGTTHICAVQPQLWQLVLQRTGPPPAARARKTGQSALKPTESLPRSQYLDKLSPSQRPAKPLGPSHTPG